MTKPTWKPIETAPKNPAGKSTGPYILLWCSSTNTIFHACWSFKDEANGWTSKSTYERDLSECHITHWMKAPDDPVGEGD